MMKRSAVVRLLVVMCITSVAVAAQDGGYDVTSELWSKAVLQVSGSPVTLVWKEVGSDTTPSGDRVASGYFYAIPDDFAYGSAYNPEVFVKIYIASNGWCNMAFNHVTVDDVTVYSAHNYSGVVDQTGTVTLTGRLVEHQYNGVDISSDGNGGGTSNVVYDQSLSAMASGTYNYSNNIMNVLFTTSTWPSGDGPPVNINYPAKIIQLTESTLMFKDEDDEIQTWYRDQGQVGDVTGTWTRYEGDLDKAILEVKNDGTIILTVYGAIYNVPAGTITVDGNFNDWSMQHLAFVDNDGPDCNDGPGLDLKEVYLAEDETFIYLRFVLNGSPNSTYQYMLGNNDRHIRVRWDGVNGYVSYSSGTGLPEIHLPNNFVYVQGNQFECKFYKSDIASLWPVDDSLNAWLDQGRETDCRDYENLPYLRFD